MDAHNATRPTLRVIFAFLHGVALGIFWGPNKMHAVKVA